MLSIIIIALFTHMAKNKYIFFIKETKYNKHFQMKFHLKNPNIFLFVLKQ